MTRFPTGYRYSTYL